MVRFIGFQRKGLQKGTNLGDFNDRRQGADVNDVRMVIAGNLFTGDAIPAGIDFRGAGLSLSCLFYVETVTGHGKRPGRHFFAHAFVSGEKQCVGQFFVGNERLEKIDGLPLSDDGLKPDCRCHRLRTPGE